VVPADDVAPVSPELVARS